jgi:hypothetical protein
MAGNYCMVHNLLKKMPDSVYTKVLFYICSLVINQALRSKVKTEL